jgi:mRNA interferase RelE/StbE
MKILYEKSFLRDIKQITDRKILDKIEQTIFDIKKAKRPDQIRKLRKMRGYKSYYRLKRSNPFA